MIQNSPDKAAGNFISPNQTLGAAVEFGHITLNLLMKTDRTRHGFLLSASAALASLALAGCISSTAPVLSDAKPVLGERGVIHVFTVSQGAAHDPGLLSFQWSGSRYLIRGKSIGYSDFTAYPYEGRDWIVQGTTQRPSSQTSSRVEYGLARRLADGTYLLIPIDEEDADQSAREKFCTKTQDASCRIATPEQLFVFARASADKPAEGGALAVVVPAGNGAKP
jgi:hypothetical protein